MCSDINCQRACVWNTERFHPIEEIVEVSQAICEKLSHFNHGLAEASTAVSAATSMNRL